jgi:hypothetical protein
MPLKRIFLVSLLLWACLPLMASWAGEADVLEVSVTAQGHRKYHFEVTVAHADTGWEHYADRWEVLAPDGSVLGTRTLMHPHVDEQPFTRNLSGVAIPAQIPSVEVRAHDSVHAYGGKAMKVKLPHE